MITLQKVGLRKSGRLGLVVSWKGQGPGTYCFMERAGAWDLLFHGKGRPAGLVVSWKGRACGTCCFMERAGAQDFMERVGAWDLCCGVLF
jgi:hypothetical protein